jgi:tRNA threonylcarbamoyladenosine biosynthesis protein TsaE
LTAALRLEGLEQTAALGRRLAASLRPGDIILLEGPLGAGKTALVAAIARGLDSTDDVGSPTFVLVRQYQGRLPLVHADLYRLDSVSEVAALGLLELSEDGVLAVEWAERDPSLAVAGALRLRLTPGDETTRLVDVLAAPAHLVGALGAGA